MPLTEVFATENLPERFARSIFLAGPTPRDARTASWRPEAVAQLAKLGFDGVVFNPERRSGWEDDYDDQVGWETEALAMSDIIVFWVPRDLETTPAFTTNVEFGMHVASGKVVFGAPPGSPKNRYLVATAARHGVDVHDDLVSTLRAGVDACRDGLDRAGAARNVTAKLARQASFAGWCSDLEAAGHQMAGVDVVFTSPASVNQAPFMWAARPHVAVDAQAHRRTVFDREIVVGRPDLSAVCAHGPVGEDLWDTELLVVSEFRAAGRQPGGRVVELPSGSSTNPDLTPAQVAVAELVEETGVAVDLSRVTAVRCAQAASTLSVHQVHLFEVELSAEELDCRRDDPTVRGDGSGEACVSSVRTLRDLTGDGLFDWTMVGMALTALEHARIRLHTADETNPAASRHDKPAQGLRTGHGVAVDGDTRPGATDKLAGLAHLFMAYAVDGDEPFEEAGHLDMVEQAARIVFGGEHAGFAAGHPDPEAHAEQVATCCWAPAKILLEDGSAAGPGERVWNYYDGFPVTIVTIGEDGWCETRRDDGARGPALNGARMCAIATARTRGWT